MTLQQFDINITNEKAQTNERIANKKLQMKKLQTRHKHL
jgi:hypothetical protein